MANMQLRGGLPARTRVLVVDDAAEIRTMVAAALRYGNYELHETRNGAEALMVARTFKPDVVVLDLGLPDIDGVEVCRQLRGFTDAYVLMLTARTEETDRLVGLAVGADDYMTKPFSPRELAARVEVLLRRPRSNVAADEPASQAIELGDLSIDPRSREVRVDGEPVELTRIEFDLLAALAVDPYAVLSRERIIERVWGEHWVGNDHMVSVHVANLRRKIDTNGVNHIKTVRGVGYRLLWRN